jgi:hypothetical protein
VVPAPKPAAQASTGIAARLDTLIAAQSALLMELEALAPRQHALLEADAADELLATIESRQTIIDRLVEVSAELEPYRARWESLLAAVPAGDRARMKQNLDANIARAGVIAHADGALRDRLLEKRDAAAADLAELGRGAGALDAYVDEGHRPRFQDREA